MAYFLSIAVPTPAHAQLDALLSYASEHVLAPGTLVRVPLGKREVLGVVWEQAQPEPQQTIKPVSAALTALPPLADSWRQLVSFAAQYYQRSLGEVAQAALPPQLKDLSAEQLQRRLKKKAKPEPSPPGPSASPTVRPLTAEQAQAVQRIGASPGPHLLYGLTGSGKTEVYLQAVAELLAREPQAQALVMVPEINLTPQLTARFTERFGTAQVVAMHSGMTPAQRLQSWLAAHQGSARMVLATRLGVLASIPLLRLIIVDEEHDPSYKAQDGARYSARDVAVMRGKLQNAAVVLGSATPSLETWRAALQGRYQRLDLTERIGQGALPKVRLVDMNAQPAKSLIAPPLLAAIQERAARGEQSLLLLNRRGYAPVLACHACEWKSECPHCSAYRVFHKIDRSLRCHHCGFTEPVPRACPECGNIDITPVGRGTEKLQEHLGELLAGVTRANGQPLRIARIDADSTRAAGALEQQLAQVHSGEVDVLVGTQMVAKGHDFRRITLVAAINPDGALFSSDFRAPERLFSLLMQAAGRAGREASMSSASEMWIQSFYPQHPLFAALKKHDFPAFAAQQLQEREAASMPPFASQALVRAEARSQEVAQAFLQTALEAAPNTAGHEAITLYPPVPHPVARVANIERAQMLLESPSRKALQQFLAQWQSVLHEARGKGIIRWAIDVDPLSI
jgi:primosomal protein N' (replication factor Y) (superfamily II helicase)